MVSVGKIQLICPEKDYKNPELLLLFADDLMSLYTASLNCR